ncbi:hypothetical protein COT47_06440 [Candidatus Woesearchaeota archaeon CG08_land_8_20_14_0_20_43_7]|nr:MAG: hypothetical protein COT47_06440 [Candidatus Woesearchaeota archaeon CG08_land_8_20_14_0_20_43_7]
MEKVWEVSYRCIIDHSDGSDPTRWKYLVVAETETDAFTKADGCFGYNPENKELLLNGKYGGHSFSMYGLVKKAKEYSQKIKQPDLTLDSDKDGYSLEARVSDSGDRLEFVVKKK